MKKETEEFMIRQGMLLPGARILAALSGGADSVCLLYVLAGMREKWKLEIRAVHVHHGLRGEEADRDQAFSETLSRSLQIPFSCVHVEVRKLAREQGLSEEEAARILRYQALDREAELWEQDGKGPVRVAVAHHRDDDAETVLYHLFRGSGLRGLSGIRPVRGRIIRPLLWAGRGEILAFLREEKLSWIQDSSNDSDAYTRNRMRNQILPLICQQINSRAPEHICKAAHRIRQADAYLEAQADAWIQKHGKMEACMEKIAGEVYGGCMGAEAEALLDQPEIIQTYVIRRMMEKTAPGLRDMSGVHVDAVLSLLRKKAGSRSDLPGGLCVWKTQDFLCMGFRVPAKEGGKPETEEPFRLEFETFFLEKGMKFPQKQYTKWFDYDKIQGTLSVRTRRTGDYFLLPGGGRKTVKSYMIDQKIPAEMRDRIFLLAEGSHVLWIVGWRISEGVKITSETKRVLKVQVSGGKENGR